MPTPKPAALPDPVAALVDELGSLERDLAPHLTKIARVDVLRKALRAHYAGDAYPAADEIQVQGTRYTAILGPRGNETVVNYPGLIKAIRVHAFARFATCSLAALQKNVNPAVYAKVTSVAAIGWRSLKLLETPRVSPNNERGA